MAQTKNVLLERMLERLYASLMSGPSLNCRPNNSRQRIDLTAVAKVGAVAPEAVLAALLGEKREAKVVAKVTEPPAKRAARKPLPVPVTIPPGSTEISATGTAIALPSEDDGVAAVRPGATLEAERPQSADAWTEQQAALRKLSTIADDARTFEQDTGARVLHLGFPLIHLPPGAGDRSPTRRILAPVAFIPVELTVKKGRVQSVELASAEDGSDRVIPNAALFAWIEQQTGARITELFDDATGEEPWKELNELVSAACKALELPAPGVLGIGTALVPAPRADDGEAEKVGVLPAAVLGLYPASNQSLLDDMRALVDGEPAQGPIEAFLQVDKKLAADSGIDPPGSELLVAESDPCQARAVRLARTAQGLVVHGPPGTGKSQTIANVIGDHLSRGERVLLVCDKRTALDVVKYRLDALGLGGLCAVVHDAQRDQKELYRAIRDQLEGLTELKTQASAQGELQRIDAERAQLRETLGGYHRVLAVPPAEGVPSFHELVGTWFSLPQDGHGISVATTPPGELMKTERELREIFERARREDYPNNPWRAALGVDLAAYLSQPLAEHRRRVEQVVEAARAADQTAAPEVPRFDPTIPLEDQAAARTELLQHLEPLVPAQSALLARWARTPRAEAATARTELATLQPQLALVEEGPLDAELAPVYRSAPLPLAGVSEAIAHLTAFLAIARKWYGFFFLLRRLKAAKLVGRLGLSIAVGTAERVAKLFAGVRARALLEDAQRRLSPGEPTATDAELAASIRSHHDVLQLIAAANDPRLGAAAEAIRRSLMEPAAHSALVAGLRRSGARAAALGALEVALAGAQLFTARWRGETSGEVRGGAELSPLAGGLLQRLSTVEGLLRIDQVLAKLPGDVVAATRRLAELGVEPDAGLAALRRSSTEAELGRRIRATPELQQIDPDAIKALQDRLAALQDQRRAAVREQLLHRWAAKQQDRLLAATRTRLSSDGAEVKRRLALRGQRAMRLRQVMAQGAQTEGGDPLLDLRPVWMASPQTVAQIFPRRAIFDVVIFDESSQCRLEEALPVLLRAKRVVIAGDPKQLPPTRFFESAVQLSADQEADGDQGLFEEQQAEVEDLLGAALNLEIEQCYLDVHYRSQNADLIEFSNQAFYESRLQAIPGHPSNRPPGPPVRLVSVGGVYEKRTNVAEAEEVLRIVRELLSQAEVPSIGIACFNLAQRDLIVETLDDAAAEDPAFATRLAQARTRQGHGSFEGLFVKNLENVQGDERDHLIISTTYGPDPKGRFYRRFGPLGMAGGGRRLNVLVTRARSQVHLVTSIPREIYSALPPVEAGQSPNGGWLLFSYLKYADELQQQYGAATIGAPVPAAAGAPRIHRTSTPSTWAAGLARHLSATQGVSTQAFWGNDGFCVDVALEHPTRPEDVTVGVLCDGTRYEKGVDPVEWDLFRARILEDQGWKLVRLWSPHFFRDPDGALARIVEAVGEAMAKIPPPLPAKASPAPWEDTRAVERRLLN